MGTELDEAIKKFDSKNKHWFWNKGGFDAICLILLCIIGMQVPDLIFESTSTLYNIYPGGELVLDFSTITYSTYIKDGLYNRHHSSDSEEIVNGTLLIIIAGLIPILWVIVYQILVMHFYLKLPKYIIFKEFVYFLYMFVIAFSLNMWFSKAIKWYVSWSRPDFYDRCAFNYDDISNPFCENEAEKENSWKSYPSGHASYTLTSAIACFLWTEQKLNLTNLKNILKFNLFSRQWNIKLLVQLSLAWLIYLSIWVSCTRIVDHSHFPIDTIVGFIIGFVSGHIGYRSQYFWDIPYSKCLIEELDLKIVANSDNTAMVINNNLQFRNLENESNISTNIQMMNLNHNNSN